jgi:hypothetical protein
MIRLENYAKVGNIEFHARVCYPTDIEVFADERSDSFPTLGVAQQWAENQPAELDGRDRFALIEERRWEADEPFTDPDFGLVYDASSVGHAEDDTLREWALCDDGTWSDQ